MQKKEIIVSIDLCNCVTVRISLYNLLIEYPLVFPVLLFPYPKHIKELLDELRVTNEKKGNHKFKLLCGEFKDCSSTKRSQDALYDRLNTLSSSYNLSSSLWTRFWILAINPTPYIYNCTIISYRKFKSPLETGISWESLFIVPSRKYRGFATSSFPGMPV